MGGRAMRIRILFAVLFLCAAATGALPDAGLFEQLVSGPRPVWRTGGGTSEMLVLPGGFCLRLGRNIRRFRWDRSMHLESLVPEHPLPSTSYALSSQSGTARALPHAERVRAISRDHRLSVLYYVGPRGLEFDIEVEPGSRPPTVRLESADGDFSLNRDGHLAVADESLSLKPVAYSTRDGQRRTASANYRLDDTRHVSIEISKYHSNERLVIDPVMTYATYFAGSGDDAPLAIRELEDGSVLFAGTTTSIDLPQGVSLNTILMEPSQAYLGRRCFVARVSPANKRIHFVSSLGSNFTNCTAMDVDSSGRILLAGAARGSPVLARSQAQYPTTKYSPDGFLARISADRKPPETPTY